MNRYSRTWCDVFLRTRSAESTEAEVAFLARQLPQPLFRTILDLCCGNGRHARLLAAAGYRVTGVDSDRDLIDEASARDRDAVRYVLGDMRRLADLAAPFDAVLNLWQSFGSFDDESNLEVLRQVHRMLAPGGRLVLDLYHRGYFARRQGTRTMDVAGRRVEEEKRLAGKRLQVRLRYDATEETDCFEWRVYEPQELVDEAASIGFRCRLVCADFDESTPATPEQPRMQLLFEKAE